MKILLGARPHTTSELLFSLHASFLSVITPLNLLSELVTHTLKLAETEQDVLEEEERMPDTSFLLQPEMVVCQRRLSSLC